MRKLGFMILHDGLPYLRATLEAILPQLDHFIILYSENRSQGWTTDMPKLDSKDELMKAALQEASDVMLPICQAASN